MSQNLRTILESKQALRRRLATMPMAGKLRLLDAMRERELAIRGRSVPAASLREKPPTYQARPGKG